MKTQPKVIEIKESGRKVITLIPEHQGIQVLVDAIVLKRLVAAMEPENEYDRRKRLISALDECDNHEDIDNVLETDMNWQKTVASVSKLDIVETQKAVMPEKVTDKNIDSLIG